MISDQTLRRFIRSPAVVAMLGDLIRALLWVGVAVVIGLWLWYYGVLAQNMVGELHMNDFGKFYYSARAFLDGTAMYGPNPATAVPVTHAETRQFWNMNPPHFHLVILPLARLPPLVALGLWSVASVIALVVSAFIAARGLGMTWTVRGVAWAIVIALLCSATGMVVVTGQITFLLMWPVTWAWLAARRGQWHRAAIALGVLASVKPFLAIFFLYFLVKRQFAIAMAMAGSAAACLLSGVLVFGADAYAAWLQALSGITWLWAPMNASVAGLFARVFADSPFYVPVLLAPGIVRPAALVVGTTIAVGSLLALAKDTSESAPDRVFTGLLLTAQLVSPLGWWYYVWLAAGPMFALVRSMKARPSVMRDVMIVLAVPGAILPFFMTVIARHETWMGATLGSLYGWTMLWLWLAVILDLRAVSQPVSVRS